MSKGISIKCRMAIFLFLSGIIFLGMFNYTYAEDVKPKNVLILNSYHPALSWTKGETEGITEALEQTNYDFTISVEYMDWKNYPSEENLNNLYNYYKFKYQNMPIDIVFATDDAALKFALQHRESLFSNAPVIFCGVNVGSVSQLVQGYDNVTGVLEDIDPTETIEAALKINPLLETVYVLYDNSESGATTGKLVTERINATHRNINIVPLNNLTYDELIHNVRNYGSNSIILVTTYYSDGTGRILEFEKVSRDVSSNSSVPVYHLYDMGLNNGAVGGNMLSGTHQGESAAKLGIRVLAGEDPDNIPIIAQKNTRNAFDYRQLERFNIPLDKVPENFEIINKPFSFFETYKLLVITVLSAFILLIVFLLVLLFYLRKIRKMRNELATSHEELTQTYEELTASDEELKQQFDEISSIQAQLIKSEERFRIAADGSNAVIWDLDLVNMEYYFSDRWYELLGYKRDDTDIAHGEWRMLIHPEDAPKADKARNDCLEGLTPFYNTEYRMKKKNGEYIWFNVKGKVLRDGKGKNIRFAGSLIDITESKKYESKLQENYEVLESTYEELAAAQEELQTQYDEIYISNEKTKAAEEKYFDLAYHDALTGLPNRISLSEALNNILVDNKEEALAIFFIDMDNFKYVNDTMGHTFGDQVIVGVSKRINYLLKGNSSLYRLSGDEFIVMVRDMQSQHDAEMLASHIITSFNEEFFIDGSAIHIGLSIGIAIYPDHGNYIDELLKNADIAMYEAKATGKNTYFVYNSSINEIFSERASIEKYLYKAMEKNEFEIHYQPQLDLETNKITGLEALLRWNSPELGPVSPNKFIQVAEDTHLIIPLGKWVLRNSCAFLRKLHKERNPDISISVNISILQFMQADFIDMVLSTLKENDLEPHFLELEITETMLMESFEIIEPKLKVLRENNVKVALDDFGKGYSSLNYLKELPISTIKIDKSFIDTITNGEENGNITKHIIAMGKSLGIGIVAEGVEKIEQLEYLKENQCNRIQGFYYSIPVTEGEIEDLLKDHE